jgi:hypothetical protein
MSEKVIFEVRLVETEDGLRLEMKGDKERMHEFGFGRRMRHFGRHFGHGERRAWSRCGHHFGPGFGPWWDEEPEPKEEPKPAHESPAGTV